VPESSVRSPVTGSTDRAVAGVACAVAAAPLRTAASIPPVPSTATTRFLRDPFITAPPFT